MVFNYLTIGQKKTGNGCFSLVTMNAVGSEITSDMQVTNALDRTVSRIREVGMITFSRPTSDRFIPW